MSSPFIKKKQEPINQFFSDSYIENFLHDNKLPNLKNLNSNSKSDKIFTVRNLESIKTPGDLDIALGDLSKEAGIYVYEWNSEILYIGKAKKFRDRIISHFKEGNELHKDSPVFWPLFFKHFFAQKNVNLHLIKIDGAEDRTILEIFFQKISPAKFEAVKKGFGRKNPRGHIKDIDSETLKELEKKFLDLIVRLSKGDLK